MIGTLLFTFLAAQINTKLCDKFSVGHYPMLFWGPPTKFVGSGWEPKQEKSDIRVIEDARTADRLLNWINKQVGRSVLYIHSLLMCVNILFKPDNVLEFRKSMMWTCNVVTYDKPSTMGKSKY